MNDKKDITKCPDCGSGNWERDDYEMEFDEVIFICECMDCDCKWFESYKWIGTYDRAGTLYVNVRDVEERDD